MLNLYLQLVNLCISILMLETVNHCLLLSYYRLQLLNLGFETKDKRVKVRGMILSGFSWKPLRLSQHRKIIYKLPKVENSSMIKQPHLYQLIQHTRRSDPILPSSQGHSSDSYRNIFLAPQQKMCENDLYHAKSYQLVGVRELKAYKNRAKKRTKVSAREKDDPPTERSISRDQSKKKTKADAHLLTKDEVIDCLPKLSKEISHHHLKKVNKSSWIDAFNPNPNNTNHSFSSYKVNKSKQLFKQFSLVRIKRKFIEYENQWSRFFTQTKRGQRFPTLEESIVAYRQRREQAQNTAVNQNLVKLKSSYWSNTLRNDSEIDDVCQPRKETHTLHSGIKVKGNSKLISQTDWLQGKGQQGFKFKNCPDVQVPSSTLKPIR